MMDSPWDRAIRGEDVSRPRGLSDVETSVDSNGTVKFSLGAPDTPVDKLVMTKSKKKSSYAGEWVDVDEDGVRASRSSEGRSRKSGSSAVVKSTAMSNSASEGRSRRGDSSGGGRGGGRDRSLSWECNYLEDSPKGSVGSAGDGGVSAVGGGGGGGGEGRGGQGGLPGSSRNNNPKESPRTQGRKKRSALKSIFSRALSVEKNPNSPKDAHATAAATGGGGGGGGGGAGTKKKQLRAQETQSQNTKRQRRSNAAAASKQNAAAPAASTKGKKASAIASIASAFTLAPANASSAGNAMTASSRQLENDGADDGGGDDDAAAAAAADDDDAKVAGDNSDDVSAAIRSWSSVGADEDSDDPEEMEGMDSEPENDEGSTIIVRDADTDPSLTQHHRAGTKNTKGQTQQAKREAIRGKLAASSGTSSDVDGASRTKKKNKNNQAKPSSGGKSSDPEISAAKPPVVHHTKKEKLTAMEKKARKKAKRTAKVVRRALMMLQAVAGVLDPELAAVKPSEATAAAASEAASSQSTAVAKKRKSSPRDKVPKVKLAGAGGERTILSLDVEAYERNHDRLLEVGCTRYTFHVDENEVPATHGTFECEHFIVEEHLKLRNGSYVPDNRDKFAFGESETLPLAAIASRVQDYVDSATFVVGHGMKQDLKWLKALGVHLPTNPPPNSPLVDFPIIDTQTLVVAKTNDTQNVLSLMKLMEALGQRAVALHNAGNDAYYTLCAVLLMCNHRFDHVAPSNGKRVARSNSLSSVGSAASNSTSKRKVAKNSMKRSPRKQVPHGSAPGSHRKLHPQKHVRNSGGGAAVSKTTKRRRKRKRKSSEGKAH